MNLEMHMPESEEALPGWLPLYSETTFDVVGAGGYSADYVPPDGFALGARQLTELQRIANLQQDGIVYLFRYNPQTGLVEKK